MSCGHANPEHAKFCLECGAPVGARCARCGTELPPAAKFCLECGAARASGVPHVKAGDQLRTSRNKERFFTTLADGVERFEGFVDKFTGDGVMALVGAPIAHEDHAQRACHAALYRAVSTDQGGTYG
jgi:ribosomal protein L40E